MGVSLFFSGVMSEFVSSWLGFVMTFSVPVFLTTVSRTAIVLQEVWTADANRVQKSIESHLNSALEEVEAGFADDADEYGEDQVLSDSALKQAPSTTSGKASLFGVNRALTKFVPGHPTGRAWFRQGTTDEDQRQQKQQWMWLGVSGCMCGLRPQSHLSN